MPAEADLIPAQKDTRDVVSRIARARRCSKALRRGAFATVRADLERFVFSRSIDGETAIVAITRRPTDPVDVALPPGSPPALFDVVTGKRADVANGKLTIDADAFGAHVWVAAESACAR